MSGWLINVLVGDSISFPSCLTFLLTSTTKRAWGSCDSFSMVEIALVPQFTIFLNLIPHLLNNTGPLLRTPISLLSLAQNYPIHPNEPHWQCKHPPTSSLIPALRRESGPQSVVEAIKQTSLSEHHWVTIYCQVHANLPVHRRGGNPMTLVFTTVEQINNQTFPNNPIASYSYSA